jgi:hypothetical protein
VLCLPSAVVDFARVVSTHIQLWPHLLLTRIAARELQHSGLALSPITEVQHRPPVMCATACRYRGDRQVQAVMAKLNKLYAVLRQEGQGLKVGVGWLIGGNILGHAKLPCCNHNISGLCYCTSLDARAAVISYGKRWLRAVHQGYGWRDC